MTFWEVVVIALKYAPAVWKCIKVGGDIIETITSLKKVDDGLKKAKDTKDTSDLEHLLNPPDPPGPGGSA